MQDAVIQVTSATLTSDAHIDLLNSDNTIGTLTLNAVDGAANVELQAGVELAGADVGTLRLTADGDITQGPDNIAVVGDAVFTAAGHTVTLGAGNATADFGTINVTAQTLSLNEASDTDFAGLQVTSAEVSATGAIRGTGLEVTGTDADQGLRLSATDTVDLTFAVDTRVRPLAGTDVTLRADGNTLTLGGNSDETLELAGDVVLAASTIALAPGGDLQFGSLTADATTLTLGANIRPSDPVAQSGSVLLQAENLTIGNEGATEVIIETNRGAITVASSDTTPGHLTIIGDVLVDSTGRAGTYATENADQPAPDENAPGSAGGNIRILSTANQVGTIVGTTGTADRLLVVAGTADAELGDVTTGGGTEALNALSIVAGNVNLANVAAAGNTINVDASGNVVVSGALTDTAGEILIVADGSVQLQGPVTGAGAVTVSSQSAGEAIVVGSTLVGDALTLTTGAGSVRLRDAVTATTGDLAVNSAAEVTVSGGIDAAGAISIDAAGSVRLQGAVEGGATVAVSSQAVGEAVISESTLVGDSVTVTTGAGSLRLDDAVTATAGGITLEASDLVTVSGALAAQGALGISSTGTSVGDSNAIELQSAATAAEISVSNVTGNLHFADVLVTTGAGASQGGLSVTTTGVATFASDVTAAGALTVDSNAVVPSDLRNVEGAPVANAVNAAGRLQGTQVQITVMAGDVALDSGVEATGSVTQPGAVVLAVDDGNLTLAGRDADGTALVAEAGGVDLDVSGLITVSGTTNSAGAVAADAAQIMITDTVTASEIALSAQDSVDVAVTQIDGSVGDGLVSTVGDVAVSSANSAVTLNSNVNAAANITLLAESGSVIQGKNSTADAAGGSLRETLNNGSILA